MPKRPDTYYRPESLDEALALLSTPDVAPLAGGTHLLAGEAGVDLAGVVDLQALGLNQIKLHPDRLAVGATATLSALSEFLAAELADADVTPLLQQALRQAGPNTYRNAATLGGVIATRLPDSELLAALLALEAELTLRAPDLELMALADYLAAAERPLGLITALSIPLAPGRGHSARVARTPADAPIVSLTLWNPPEGTPRLAATGLAQRPLRLDAVEAILAGDPSNVEAAAAAAQAASRHPGDFRGDAAYRAAMAAVLTRRVLGE